MYYNLEKYNIVNIVDGVCSENKRMYYYCAKQEKLFSLWMEPIKDLSLN